METQRAVPSAPEGMPAPPAGAGLPGLRGALISIRTRLVMSFLVITIVPLVYVGWVFLRDATGNMLDLLVKSSMSHARKASLDAGRFLDARRGALERIAAGAAEAADPAEYLRAALQGEPALDALWLVPPNGGSAISPSGAPAPAPDPAALRRLAERPMAVWLDKRPDGAPRLVAAVSSRAADGTAETLLLAEFRRLPLDSLLADNAAGQTSRLLLLDGVRGAAATHPEACDTRDVALLSPAIAGRDYGAFDLADAPAGPQVAVALPVVGHGLTLLLLQSRAEVYATVGRFRGNLFVVLGLTTLVAVLLGLAVARSIAGPILTVARGTNDLAAGKLGVRIDLKSRDEVGQLAHNFNFMADSLEARMAELQDAYGELQERARTIHETNVILDRKIFEIGTLYEVGRRMGEAGLDMDRLLDVILDKALDAAGGERGSLMLLGDDDLLGVERVRVRDAESGATSALEGFARNIRIAPGEGVAGRVIQSGEMHVANRPADDPDFKPYDDAALAPPRQLVCVPLKIRDHAFGVINIANRAAGGDFTPRDTELLSTLASQAALALQNARLFKLAITDGLTELFMRRHFMNRLEEEMKRSRRYKSTFSVLFMDIDHFKSFNDTYGHAQGDVVLKHFAQRIRDCVRTDIDIPARYGGEEFVILLPETDAEGGRLAAERIRRAVEAFAFPYEKGPLHVTTSVGVAAFPDHAAEGAELLKKADTALYRCKEAGRNTVLVYDPAMGVVEQ